MLSAIIVYVTAKGVKFIVNYNKSMYGRNYFLLQGWS